MRRLALIAAGLALALPATARAFVPTDPLAARQWYLTQVHAFDAWPEMPFLDPVKVAVVDSGIDGTHPEFAGRIAASKSFVGGSALTDEQGHGTFVAGEIAAGVDNGEGIAGLGFAAQLLVAKVVRADGTISLAAEASGIRWAAAHGARVINLSLGGVRDPANPKLDTYSKLEADAVAYAVSRGALVVAAVGNGDQAPSQPWPYASYPAALPHVIGVSALARDGSVPAFSDRDPVFNDLAAPGEGLLSTLPYALTAKRPGCVDQGYSDCGPDEYRLAEGTSFAAPLVSATAALLLAQRPDLAADQVAQLLERSAVDATAATGCVRCPRLRDPLSGWGRLDVAAAIAALDAPFPPADRLEPNDGASTAARTVYGREVTLDATADYWDDPADVYRIRLQPGERLAARLTGPGTRLELWRPGAIDLTGASKRELTMRAAVGQSGQLAFTARADGWYYLRVAALERHSGAYELHFTKTR